jgi:NAD(P)-dependent dehydrogenase (short-subunit alcohol dehydrogenase family)
MTTAAEPRPPGLKRPLENKVALVTGGTRGIGAVISHCLAAHGAEIAAGYWRQSEPAEIFLADLNAAQPGRLITLHHGNIGSAEDCRRVVREVINQHGRLDILVNNAGIIIDRTAAMMTDDWHRVISVHLSGAFFVAQAALEHMAQRGTGRIINVFSVTGETGRIGQADYVTSRSGLLGLTRSLSREALSMLGRAQHPLGDGIGLTVNGVTPGYVATGMLATIPDAVTERLRARIPAGRLGRPEEVARVVAFLADDDSSYITGQILFVNGGLDM